MSAGAARALYAPHFAALTPSTRLCLVDYGNYPFLFDVAAHWPKKWGRMHYVFASGQSWRNDATRESRPLPSGGAVHQVACAAANQETNVLKRGWMEKRAAPAFVEKLRQVDPDLVIGANNPLCIQRALSKWCRSHGRRSVYWLQDLRGLAAKLLLRKKFWWAADVGCWRQMKLERSLIGSSDHVISITEEFCPAVQAAGLRDEQCTVLPNWGPVERLAPRPKDTAWSRSAGLADKRVLMYAGNLGRKHDPELLLRLCLSLARERDVRVVAMTEGPAADWLTSAAAERRVGNLVLHAPVATEQLPDALGSADICLAVLEPEASRFSVPSKIWTYFCAGKPVVLSIPSDNQGASVVREIRAGWTSEPHDGDAFVDQCRRMLALRQDERAAMGARGRAYAEQHFAIGNILERVAGCLNSALKVGAH